MPSDNATLDVLVEIRELLKILAEPTFAQTDAKPRESLRQIVGRSHPKAAAVRLMDGTLSQAEVSSSTSLDKGSLSKMITLLRAEGLLDSGDKPRLNITIPKGFFEQEAHRGF